MAAIMNLFNTCFAAVSGWFVRIFTSSGMVEVYMSILFIVFATRFLLVPVLGKSKGSDTARSKSKEDTSDE